MRKRRKRVKELQRPTNTPQRRITFTTERTEFYSAPLPHPRIMREFEDICPGSADRIITQFEEQGRHRRSQESNVITSNIDNEKRGQIFGFTLCFVAIIGGIFLLYLDKTVVGLVALLGALGTPAGLFIYSKIQGRKQLEEKKDALAKRKASENGE
jgi:uncharacterized membrane protein